LFCFYGAQELDAEDAGGGHAVAHKHVVVVVEFMVEAIAVEPEIKGVVEHVAGYVEEFLSRAVLWEGGTFG